MLGRVSTLSRPKYSIFYFHIVHVLKAISNESRMKINMIYTNWLNSLLSYSWRLPSILRARKLSEEGWVIVFLFFMFWEQIFVQLWTRRYCSTTTNVFHCYKRYIQAICSLFPTSLRNVLSFIFDFAMISQWLHTESIQFSTSVEWNEIFPSFCCKTTTDCIKILIDH